MDNGWKKADGTKYRFNKDGELRALIIYIDRYDEEGWYWSTLALADPWWGPFETAEAAMVGHRMGIKT